MTALNLYSTTPLSASLTTAGQAADASGGTATTYSIRTSSTDGVWWELRHAAFTTNTNFASPPTTPPGNGWLLDKATYDGASFAGGTWTGTIQVTNTSGMTGCTMRWRFYAFDISAGTYRSLGSFDKTGVTINSTATDIVGTGTISAFTLGANERLYYDIWLFATTNSGGSNTNSTVRATSTSAAGATTNYIQTAGVTIPPPPAGTPIAVGTNFANSNVANASVTTTDAIPIGATAFLAVSRTNLNFDSNGIDSVSDSAGGNTWVSAGFVGDDINAQAELWYCASVATEIPSGGTITANGLNLLTSGMSWELSAFYCEGLDTSGGGPLDGTPATFGTATTSPWATGNLTTAHADDLLIGIYVSNQDETSTIASASSNPASGWTLHSALGTGGNMQRVAWTIVSATSSTYHINGTQAVGNGGAAILYAFKIGGGGTTGNPANAGASIALQSVANPANAGAKAALVATTNPAAAGAKLALTRAANPVAAAAKVALAGGLMAVAAARLALFKTGNAAAAGARVALGTVGNPALAGAKAALNTAANPAVAAAKIALKASAVAANAGARLALKAGPPAPLTPIISAGQPTYGTVNGYPANYLTDRAWTSHGFWRSVDLPSVGSPVNISVDLSGVSSGQRGPVVVRWVNGMANYWNDTAEWASLPKDYTLQGNAAAGGSLPGSGWVTLATITSNVYTSREHEIDLTGYNWFRMSITAANGTAPNNDIQLLLDIYNNADGLDQDDWLFAGDSITREALSTFNLTGSPWNTSYGPLENTIHNTLGGYTPLIMNGGWGGMNIGWMDTNFAAYTASFSGRYLPICFGTNDVNVGFDWTQSNVDTWYASLLSVVDKALAAGWVPIVPFIPWGSANSGHLGTNANTVNTHLAAHLTTDRPGAMLGPDLYTPFFTNQSLIDTDGIHPTFSGTSPVGLEVWQQTWHDWMVTNIYGGTIQPQANAGAKVALQSVANPTAAGAKLALTQAGVAANAGAKIALQKTAVPANAGARVAVQSIANPAQATAKVALQTLSNSVNAGAKLAAKTVSVPVAAGAKIALVGTTNTLTAAAGAQVSLRSLGVPASAAARVALTQAGLSRSAAAALALSSVNNLSAEVRLALHQSRLTSAAARVALGSATDLIVAGARVSLKATAQLTSAQARLALQKLGLSAAAAALIPLREPQGAGIFSPDATTSLLDDAPPLVAASLLDTPDVSTVLLDDAPRLVEARLLDSPSAVTELVDDGPSAAGVLE